MATPKPRQPVVRSFNLNRWFAIVGLISIATISALAGWALSRFVSDEMLKQEGELTQQFVQTLVSTERSLQSYFAFGEAEDSLELELAMSHISRMQDMLRANVYNVDERVIWSSDRQLEGHTFGPNDELEEALAGHLVVHTDVHHKHGGKTEHRNLEKRADLFVEIYVPVRDPGSGEVVGAIEFYKNPQPLFHALQRMRYYIALGAALAGGFLYLALAGLVRRADGLMRAQERRLIDTETLAVIGEMSSAVAHGIRNPLASIRSSAEVIQVADLAVAREAGADIVSESDRLEAWVRELLSFSRPLEDEPEPVQVAPLIERCIEDFGRDLEKRRIDCRVDSVDGLPEVRGDALLLGQVLHSLVSNAVEAINRDGCLTLRAAGNRGSGEVMLAIGDTGPGMNPEQLSLVGKPFYTTKARGLGVGLSQVRRIVERYGGRIEIDSEPGRGTEVRLYLLAA
ncbi:MAG: two-component sensor histidine kinase [Rhodocyclaceae bacterium]|nr:two-component sensor histidine kinase [Rhodocyclaceae bacterium]